MRTPKPLRFALLIVITLIASYPSSAGAQEPTGEKVIQKFIDVTGGADAYAKLKSRVSTGTISMAGQNMSGPIAIYQKAPNLMRVTGSLGGITFDRGFDGDVAYEMNSMQGVRIIEGDERDLMEQQSLASPLNNLAESFTNIENTGVEQIEGRDAYRVELTLKGGDKFIEWFDTESGLLSQMQITIDSLAGRIEVTINNSDWREVDGVKVPFKTKQQIAPFGIEQTVEFTKIEGNVDIPPDKIAAPEEVKEFLKDAKDPQQQPATQPTTKPAGTK